MKNIKTIHMKNSQNIELTYSYKIKKLCMNNKLAYIRPIEIMNL